MKRLILCLAAGILLLALPCFASSEITALTQLNTPGMVIGVSQGSAAELAVQRELPQAGLAYFTDNSTAYLAVAQGKIDAFVFDQNQMRVAIQAGVKGVHLMEETLGETVQIAVGISPKAAIPDLENQLNRFIQTIRADGTLGDMYRRWAIEDNNVMPEIEKPANPTLHLTVGTTASVPPFSYYAGTSLTGFDIELAYRFAAWLGADVQFKIFDYGGIIPATVAGNVDCVMANLNITPERREAITFSEILYEEKLGVMVQGNAQPEAADTPAWQAYNGKRIGVLTGPIMEGVAHTYFPDSEYILLERYPDCIAMLFAGKIDAFLADEPEMKSAHAEQPQIDYIHDRITNQEYSFAFRKNDEKSAALCQELNDFLAMCREDGTLQELEDIWFGVDESRKTVDMSDLTGQNGTIRVVTTSTDMPFSYIKDGKNVGYDIDLVVRFCLHAGYQLELGDVDFSARIPAVQSGKYDFTTDMNVTPERMEEVLFSNPTSTGGVVLAILAGSESTVKNDAAASDPVQYTSLAQLSDKRIGIPTGSSFELMVEESLPDAELFYYNNQSDLLMALSTNKIDAFPADEPVIRYMMNYRSDIACLPKALDSFDFAYCFAKTEEGEQLKQEFDAFLMKLKADGSLEALTEKWFGNDESAKTLPDLDALTAENGILRMATDGDYMPFEYVRNGDVVGYDVDIAAQFCEAYGYGLAIDIMNLDAVLPAVQSGKCDFGGSAITITPERAESVLFSEPNYNGGIVMTVRKVPSGPAATQASASLSEQNSDESGVINGSGNAQAAGSSGFFDRFLSSFNKTFIREERWKLFLEGIGTTLIITLLAILFGTALGFLVFLACRRGNKPANTITRFSMWLVQGTPMVVLLMILYYIVFGSVSISGVPVAVIGFTLTFGASVFGLIKMGVGTIDRGQYEAALALGHSDSHTFFRIILPQAIPHVLPAYQSEIVGLIKATAIVGYIAVQDLTKMGDIVRSRTYEAFFPLIAVTIIYFVLEGLLSFAVSCIRIHIDPKKRSRERILKGVKTDD
ncbi:MAG: transporter substrate-binding domain-containing protein [Clostridia bacterium]|nr:transporter substrate-binding domain-containing protein [Clostridia bacterium]